MGGIVKSVFGGGSSKGREVDLNREFSTGTSTLQGGKLALDPRIDALRSQYLGGVQDLQGGIGSLGGFAGRFGQLGEEFAGNQGALINARMSPLQQNIARQRGQLGQSLGRRGLGGTTFGNQALTNFETESGRALGEARALATADALQARQGLLGAEMGATQASTLYDTALNDLLRGASGDIFNQEIAGLGLGSQSIQGLLGAQAQQDQIAQQSRGQDMNLFGALAGAAGSYLTGGLIPPTAGGSIGQSVFNRYTG